MSDQRTDTTSEVFDVKDPITYDEQVKRISGKGFIIEDVDACKEFLKQASYYRLLAYYLPFKKKDGTYFKGIPFKRIQRIYEFDSRLRNLISRIVEQLEFYVRTQLSYHMSFTYGSLGYLDPTIYNSRHNHKKFLDLVSECIDENKRTLVVQHHNKKYGGKFPLWVIIEFFSTGMLSYLYADLHTPDRKKIAAESFNTSAECLKSWLRCLTDLRNRCAHCARLYYWNFPAIPRMPNDVSYTFDRKLFSQILMLKHLYPDKQKWNNDIAVSIETLIEEYLPDISLKHIGFPPNWKELLKA